MRSFTTLVSLALLAGCAAVPQVDVDAETAALRARSEALSSAEAAMDAETAITFWAEDAIIQAPGAPEQQGKHAILDGYTEFFGALKSFKSTTTNVTLAASGDLAWEHGVNDMVVTTPGGDVAEKGKYLSVWKKVDGQWYVAAVAFSSNAPAQPQPAQ
jgi:uncharacterized protein (TIGR02246 family)